MKFTVAVKFKDRPVMLCGEFNREGAERSAKHLRDSWKRSRLTPPTSIRVRKL